jgi:ribosomal protein S18 acetylase RimI-like enzyme
MDLIVRPLVDADRPGIAEMLVESGSFSDEEVRVALEMIDLGLKDGPEHGYPLFAAEVDGAVGGYACIGPTPLTRSTWHLYWICVHPQQQGRNVGRELHSHIEHYVRVRQGERLVVETSGRPDYERQRRFYEAVGYCVAGRIRDYYKPGDDCVFYCKVLL